jgi:uncharacterized protein
MPTPEFLLDGPDDAPLTVLLAHGAGAAMDSPFMEAFASGLAGRGYRVARFEFPYMAERRKSGRKPPPNTARVLLDSWAAAIDALGDPGKLVIGGKSLGGRTASLVADGAGVRGLVCLGYPFQAPGRAPDPARTQHLASLVTPTLILQGTRDPFGGAEQVAGFDLAPAVGVYWLEDGDHGFKPRKSSGRTEQQNWDQGIDAIAGFLAGL